MLGLEVCPEVTIPPSKNPSREIKPQIKNSFLFLLEDYLFEIIPVQFDLASLLGGHENSFVFVVHIIGARKLEAVSIS